MSDTIKFTLSCVGEKTHEKWHGEFTIKTWLSHRDELVRDARRRELLGDNPQYASERQASQAELFSELEVRVVGAPAWWAASSGGLDLRDDAPVKEVFERAIKAERDAMDALKKEADAAKGELREVEPVE